MKKNKLVKSLTSLVVIISALGTSSCSNETHVISRFELYETFKEAYDLYCDYGGFDYSDWVGFDYYYYFTGQETIYTTLTATGEPATIEGQTTQVETIQATNIDGVINGHEELDVQYWDTYIGGGVWGSYYDGTTLYTKEKYNMSMTGEYVVNSNDQEIDFRYYSQTPYDNVSSIITRFIGYGDDGEHLADIGYLLMGEIEQEGDNTIITLEADVIQEDYSIYYGDGIIYYDIIVSFTFDKDHNPVSIDYISNFTYDFYYDYITDFEGYYSEETNIIHFEFFDDVVEAPSWIYE